MSNSIRQRRIYLIICWSLYSIPYLLLVLLFILLAKDKLGFIPTFDDLENPKNNIASEVYSADNVLLGKYYLENRTYVDFEELSPNIVNALLATEDIRFHRHSGVDARGVARMFIKSILLGQHSGGASTITQQLAKNLYPRDTTYYRWGPVRVFHLGIAKFKEWNTAVKLERNYTKNEILVMYLNTVPFGSNTFGIKSAAKTFFDTSPDSLNLEDAALLIGVLKAQSRYSPVLNPERSLGRRNIVLNQMRKYGYITETQFDSLSVLPIELKYRVQDHTVGLATYLRQYLQMIMTSGKPERERYFSYDSFLEDSLDWETNPLFGWANKNFKPDGSPYNLYRDGLRIHTTINSKMQQYAEEAVEEHLSQNLQPLFFKEKKNKPYAPFSEDLSQQQMESILNRSIRQSERYRLLRNAGATESSIEKAFNTPVEMTVFSWNGDVDTIMTPMDSILYYKHILRAGFMSMEPSTGYVRAYVGGPDFRYFKYDHVKLAARQAGSTFKPFLYTLAMQEGYSPCDELPNVPQTFVEKDSTWTPESPGGKEYEGKMVTLKWGLANSVNNISAWLVKQFPPQVIVDDVVKRLGIESYIIPVNSIMFGVSDVTLYELVGAFNTYANKGVYIEPIFITRIEDKNGNVISTFKPKQSEAFSEQTAYLMVNLLKAVVDAGTGRRLRHTYNFVAEMGGKTGTTQNHSDGWYMGLTPKLVSGVWVGAEDRSVHFDELALGQGANMALPIWALYMKRIYEDGSLGITEEQVFEEPPNFNIQIDCEINDMITSDDYEYEFW